MQPLFLLGLVFLVLKLVDVIDWSYWLVLAPFYIKFLLILCACIIAAIHPRIKR